MIFFLSNSSYQIEPSSAWFGFRNIVCMVCTHFVQNIVFQCLEPGLIFWVVKPLVRSGPTVCYAKLPVPVQGYKDKVKKSLMTAHLNFFTIPGKREVVEWTIMFSLGSWGRLKPHDMVVGMILHTSYHSLGWVPIQDDYHCGAHCPLPGFHRYIHWLRPVHASYFGSSNTPEHPLSLTLYSTPSGQNLFKILTGWHFLFPTLFTLFFLPAQRLASGRHTFPLQPG